MTEGNLTLGGEHTMYYIYDVLLNCVLEAYLILLTKVAPVILMKTKKNRSFDKSRATLGKFLTLSGLLGRRLQSRRAPPAGLR